MEYLISGRCWATPKMLVDTLSRILIVLNQLQCVRVCACLEFPFHEDCVRESGHRGQLKIFIKVLSPLTY